MTAHSGILAVHSAPIIPESGIGAISILLTATVAAPLLPYVDRANLPPFDRGPCWTVAVGAVLESAECFDFAIVLCAAAAHLAASVDLVQRLNGRRVATVLLVPESIESFLSITPTFLTVIGPDDLSRAFQMLAHALLASVMQEGIVCCDFADILCVIDDGMRAQVLSIEAPSSGEAVQGLIKRLAPFVNSSGYGVCAALDTRFGAKGGMRDYYALFDVLKQTVRQDAFVLASAPLTPRNVVAASAMVVIAPSSRYFKNLIRSD